MDLWSPPENLHLDSRHGLHRSRCSSVERHTHTEGFLVWVWVHIGSSMLEIRTNKQQHGFLERQNIRQGEAAISGGEEESEQKKNKKKREDRSLKLCSERAINSDSRSYVWFKLRAERFRKALSQHHVHEYRYEIAWGMCITKQKTNTHTHTHAHAHARAHTHTHIRTHIYAHNQPFRLPGRTGQYTRHYIRKWSCWVRQYMSLGHYTSLEYSHRCLSVCKERHELTNWWCHRRRQNVFQPMFVAAHFMSRKRLSITSSQKLHWEWVQKSLSACWKRHGQHGKPPAQYV